MKALILTNSLENYRFVSGVASLYGQLGEDHIIDFYGKHNFSFDYDIGVSFMYQHRVPKEQLTKPWFNFHPGPLPEYKGRNLCYHAIMNRETEFGATLHYMDEGFDTGDIIDVGTFVIREDWNAEDLSHAAIAVSKGQFMNYFPRIIAGEEFPRTPNVGGHYYPKSTIGDTLVCLDGEYAFNINRFVRSVTYKDFHPKLVVGDITYKIVKE